MNFFQRMAARVNNMASGLAAEVGSSNVRQRARTVQARRAPHTIDSSPGFEHGMPGGKNPGVLDRSPGFEHGMPGGKNPGVLDGSPGFLDPKGVSFFGATGISGTGNVALAQKRQAGANMSVAQILSAGQGLNRGWTYDPVFNPLPAGLSARNFGQGVE